MEHYCEMNKSGFKVPELDPLPKGVPPENYEKYTSKYPILAGLLCDTSRSPVFTPIIDWLINLSRAGSQLKTSRGDWGV